MTEQEFQARMRAMIAAREAATEATCDRSEKMGTDDDTHRAEIMACEHAHEVEITKFCCEHDPNPMRRRKAREAVIAYAMAAPPQTPSRH